MYLTDKNLFTKTKKKKKKHSPPFSCQEFKYLPFYLKTQIRSLFNIIKYENKFKGRKKTIKIRNNFE